MVTNAELEPEDPTKGEQVMDVARIVIAGHPQGAIRRILLWTLLASSSVIAFLSDGPVAPIAAVVMMVTMMLLALTDNYA